MKGDYDKRLMLDYIAQKERKRKRFWRSRRSGRHLGDTYKYWSLKYLLLFLLLTILIVYVVIHCEHIIIEWCDKMLNLA